MKVLILGHKGMLGHMVHKYLSTKDDCKLYTTDLRWPTEEFKDFIFNFWYVQKGDYIINCIGAIHQRTDNFDVNTDLPIWLDESIHGGIRNCKIIHPGTDCEIDDDEYGISKRKAAEYLLEKGQWTKIIKTSIIGHELNTKASLLEWFLNTDEKEINGWSEYYWNGNTTLQWAKICYDLMNDWYNYYPLTIPGTDCISKYDLLNTMKDVYGKDITINKHSTQSINKCTDFTLSTPSIDKQLKEMKEYYNE